MAFWDNNSILPDSGHISPWNWSVFLHETSGNLHDQKIEWEFTNFTNSCLIFNIYVFNWNHECPLQIHNYSPRPNINILIDFFQVLKVFWIHVIFDVEFVIIPAPKNRLKSSKNDCLQFHFLLWRSMASIAKRIWGQITSITLRWFQKVLPLQELKTFNVYAVADDDQPTLSKKMADVDHIFGL